MNYPTPRGYNKLAPDFAELIDASEFQLLKAFGSYGTLAGTGYWVRNGKQSYDSVHETEREDATHVAWYPKPKVC